MDLRWVRVCSLALACEVALSSVVRARRRRVRSGLVVTAVLFVGWVGSAVLVSAVVVGGGWVVVCSVVGGGASGCCTGDEVRGVYVGSVSVGEPRPDAIGVVGPVGLGVACAEGAPYVSRTCWNAARRNA